ncbi:PsbP-related protein [Paenibacillus sp. 1P07SE]|uniref:PsbP-related protein n=1 Tax=Paenibacillus sp. 1P07SE TaxID=3132209 RepID=UPI0039A475A2
MNTKTSIQKLAAVGLVASMILAGCSSNDNNGGNDLPPPPANNNNTNAEQVVDNNAGSDTPVLEGTALLSATEDMQITLPDGWREDQELNPVARLSASDRAQEKYVMVIATSKQDLAEEASLDDYINIFKENTTPSVDNFEATAATDTTVDGSPAKQIEITGEVQKIKVHYLATFVEKDDAFYQVITWSTQNQFPDHKEEFDAVSHSLQVLKPLEATTTPDGGSADLEVYEGTSGNFQIMLPGDWTEETTLTPGADIQAARMAQEDYLAVITEPKSTFSGDTTLEDYLDLVLQNGMLEAIEGAQMSDPEAVDVGGKPGLQFMLTGSVEKGESGLSAHCCGDGRPLLPGYLLDTGADAGAEDSAI